MKKKSLLIRIAICLIPFSLIGIFYVLMYVLKGITFPACPSLEVLGILCPACGNTRAVLALSRFDVLTSLRCNPIIVGLLMLLIMLYIELIAWSFGKKVKTPIHSKVFMFTLAVLIGVFYILRNIFPVLAPV